MPLSRFPRINLSHLPTPLEPLSRLSRELGGPEIYVKRDDCTGLATGGNKARKLEFLLGDAIANNCDTIMTVGGLQSNHARQTAAAAAKLGLKCELFLEDIPGTPREGYSSNGNILLDRLLGAKVNVLQEGASPLSSMEMRANEIEQAGGKPYVIPMGGSNGIGSLGYVDCAFELVKQWQEQRLNFDYIVMATGSCGTQAGLLAGLAMQDINVPVIGISVLANETVQKARLRPVIDETCDLLGLSHILDDQLICNGNFFHPSYGVPNDGTLEAVNLLAQTEAILLDPVYTGKGMAGLIDHVRQGIFTENDRVLFLHTGGQVALFPYEPMLKKGD